MRFDLTNQKNNVAQAFSLWGTIRTPQPPQIHSAWQSASFRAHSPKLLFGRMFEDPSIELQAFPPNSRVFCIASAGCTARALAAAHYVTAVDINPLQLAYAQSRATGSPALAGTADRLMAAGRSLLPLLGWTNRKLSLFLNMTDPAEQLAYWDCHLDTPLWRTTIDALLSPTFLGLAYAAPFVRSLKTTAFGPQIRARLRRGSATHPNRSNPYAWRLLLNQSIEPEPAPPAHPIKFACADAADFLESSPPQSFDAFSLSNIADGASQAYVDRLQASVQHAAAPAAVIVTRSFAETPSSQASTDRSLLWGKVAVGQVPDLPGILNLRQVGNLPHMENTSCSIS